MPQAFEPNLGQTDPRVRFLSRGRGYTAFFTASGAVLQEPSSSRAITLEFAGADRNAQIAGLDPQPGRSNYFSGSEPRRWLTGIPHYGRIEYRELYPGIDLAYYGDEGQIEFDLVLGAGADPKRLRMRFGGLRTIRIAADGDLLLETEGGELRLRKPAIYQDAGGRKEPVDGRYVVRGRNEIGFEIAAYRPDRKLVIDPVLVFSTYLGGSGSDAAYGAATDSSGNLYVSGTTSSANFPRQGGLQNFAGTADAFVAKISPGGTLIYSTFIGGSGREAGASIAVDGSGSAYVTGQTASSNFPLKNPAQPLFGGTSDAFIVKLNPAGNALVYSTYLGGSLDEYGFGIALDAAGDAVVSGFTLSTNFPTVHPAQAANAGGKDEFIAMLNAAGSAFVYATYLGGSGSDYGNNVTVDAMGNAYVVGDSASANFPVLNAFQSVSGGLTDGTFARFDPDGVLLSSTYLGGSGIDAVRAVRLDANGFIYLTGETTSVNFPVLNALQSNNAGGYDGFLLEMNPSATSLVYSTYLGGSADDRPNSLDMDANGSLYISGFTKSSNYPAVNRVRPFGGGADAFVTKVNNAGTAILFSTTLGGSGTDEGNKLAADSFGNVYLVGDTASSGFPTTPGAIQRSLGGGSDAFAARIATCDITLSPAAATFDVNGGTGTVLVSTTPECSWSAASNAAWLSVTSETSGPGSGNFTYTVEPNATGGTLSGAITVGTQAFTVTETGGTVTLTGISPASGGAGATVNVTLTGTNFAPGATVSTDAPDITVSNVVVASGTQITATFTIAAAAASGTYNVWVTSSGVPSGTVPFTIATFSPVRVNAGGPAYTDALGGFWGPDSGFTVSGGTTSSTTAVFGASEPVLYQTARWGNPPGSAATTWVTTVPNGAYTVNMKFVDGLKTAAGQRQFNILVNGQTVASKFDIFARAGATNQAVDFSVPVNITGGQISIQFAPVLSNPKVNAIEILPGSVPAPVVSTIAPSSVAPGSTVPVTISGSNFLSTVVVNAGQGTSLTNVAVVSPTQITATLAVASGAAAGTNNVTVSTAGGASNTVPLTIGAGPGLTSVSPNSGAPGAVVNVTLTGSNFTSGATVATTSPDIAVNNVAFVSATQITAIFNIGPNAVPGSANVTVTTSAGTSGPVPFTIGAAAPTLTAVSPASGAPGASVPVTFTGTNFAAGATIAVSGSGVTASGITVVSPTQITATFDIAANAAAGPQNVTVTTSGGTSGAVVFTVNAAAPTLTAISPSSGAPGVSVPVTLTGTNFAAGATITVSGSGVTASGITVVSPTQITASFDIAANAAAGPRNVTVTTSGGTSGAVVFTVNTAAPTLTAISPASGAPGVSVPVTLTGTNFVAGATIAVSGSGVTASGVTVVSPTQITATFDITANAAAGPRNVTVTTSGGTSGAVVFTVNGAAPTLTAVSPSSGAPGASIPVTLTGTNFVAGATIAVSGSGVTASAVTVVSPTQITATFDIAANAAAGPQNVTVTTSGGTSGAVVFTVNAAAPTLTAISPSSGAPGTSVPVTLTGTNFAAGATVAVSGSDVSMSAVTVVSPTQITATFDIAANAAAGARSVTVTTSGGTSGPVPFTVATATFAPIRVNAGGPAFTDPLGQVWAADNGFNNGGGTTTVAAPATGTPAPALYQTAHWGNPPNVSPALSYQTAVPNGAYTVNLKFFDGVLTAPAQRVFNIVINGQTVASNFDIVAQSGGTNQAIDRQFPVNVTNGQISIQFVAVNGNPKVSGIEILPGTPPAPAITSVSPPSGDAGTSFPVTITGTDFASDPVVNAGPNVQVTNVSVVSPTQITASFTIPAGAPQGAPGVRVTTPGGTTGAAPFSVTWSGPSPLRVNAGGAGYTDALGQYWSADFGHNNTGGSSFTTNAITGTYAPALYQSAHYGNLAGSPQLSYTFGVPDGDYIVNLKFADTAKSATGQRVFSVAINGQAVLSNFDIFAQTRQTNQAIDTPFPVTVTGGQIMIQFTATTFNPKVCAIEIVPAASVSAPTVSGISPASAAAGTSVPVTIAGSGFGSGVVVAAGPKVIVKNVAVAGPAQITATFQVPAGTAPGTVNASVTTAGGTASTPFTTQ